MASLLFGCSVLQVLRSTGNMTVAPEDARLAKKTEGINSKLDCGDGLTMQSQSHVHAPSWDLVSPKKLIVCSQDF